MGDSDGGGTGAAAGPTAGSREYHVSTAWLGAGLLAVIGLLVAVFRLVQLNLDLGLAAAALLGAAAYYCLDQYWVERQVELRKGPGSRRRPLTGRAREIALAPSFEV